MGQNSNAVHVPRDPHKCGPRKEVCPIEVLSHKSSIYMWGTLGTRLDSSLQTVMGILKIRLPGLLKIRLQILLVVDDGTLSGFWEMMLSRKDPF